MKTTVEISDPLLAAARQEATRRGTTLRALVEEGLATVLAASRRPADQKFALREAAVGGNGLQAEFRERGWEAIRDAAYGEPPPAGSGR